MLQDGLARLNLMNLAGRLDEALAGVSGLVREPTSKLINTLETAASNALTGLPPRGSGGLRLVIEVYRLTNHNYFDRV